MCVRAIVDADALTAMANDRFGHYEKLREWFRRGDGRIISTNEPEFEKQLKKRRDWERLTAEYRRANRIVLVEASRVEDAKRALSGVSLRSRTGDVHLLALALAADVAVLCTDDNRLKDDFRDTRVLPRLRRRQRAVYPLPPPAERDRAASKKMLSRQRQFVGDRRCPGEC